MKATSLLIAMAITIGFYQTPASAFQWHNQYESAVSASMQCRIDAKPIDSSPNEDSGRNKVRSYKFTCTDTATKKTLWSKTEKLQSLPLYFVSDTGWGVFLSDDGSLAIVDNTGKKRCTIPLFTDAFTKTERHQYIENREPSESDWTDFFIWYFLDDKNQNLFVVRPWWGRRIFIDLDTCKVTTETSALNKQAEASERNYAKESLRGFRLRLPSPTNRTSWEVLKHTLNASYLAGQMGMEEAIPTLKMMQDVEWGLECEQEPQELKPGGSIDPNNFQARTWAQIIHLSLRRLGQEPEESPLNYLVVEYKDKSANHLYSPKKHEGSRTEYVDQIKKGMKPEQVLDLIDGPDFIESDTWEYDMDTEEPYTLIIKWKDRGIKNIEKTPPRWKEGFVRDKRLKYGLAS